MKQLLQEIGNLIQEKEDSQKEFEQTASLYPGNWCYPGTPTIDQREFDERVTARVNAYVKRLVKQSS
jgi:hypothetical protein